MKEIPLEEKYAEYEKPVKTRFLIKKEGETWSLLRRINFYVEWIPRILNENKVDEFKEFYNGFIGDVITYMVINGYDENAISNIRNKLLTLKGIIEKSNIYDNSFIILFQMRYKDIVDLLYENGIYFPIRFDKLSYRNFVRDLERMIAYTDEIERDILRGQDMFIDLTISLEKIANFIKNYPTNDEKLSFLKDVVVKKIKELKAKVGSIKTDRSGEKFSEEYGKVIGVIYDFLSAVEKEGLKEKIFNKYFNEFLGISGEEIKEKDLIKIVEKAIEKNPEFKEKLWSLMKEKLEEVDKNIEEEGEGII